MGRKLTREPVSDPITHAIRQEEKVRQLRIRPRGHAEAKTFIVPGAIEADMVIPPVFFALDPDNTIPEVKSLYELRGMLSAGTADLTFTLNGVAIAGSDLTIDTDPTSAPVVLSPSVPIRHGDYVRVGVDAATSAEDLSLALFLVTRQA